ncbi:biotin synthase BioB [Mobilicoccus massiliensis]|uniref:biotin synthase BioB n=1 Tax=Mobilicoccus massiliensis TaxID=1522310 RepID=UPI000590295F|nr:biotin synthase BioB [Mobilicoccus massiliensis]
MKLIDRLVEKALRRETPTREEALAVLRTPDSEILDVVAGAYRVRREFFGNRVKLNYLVNIKSGLCPEDCTYCSQRLGSEAEILKYSLAKPDAVLSMAKAGVEGGAKRVCLVSSGRGPSDRDITKVTDAIEALKGEHPDVEVCACLGLLKEGQAQRLADAGADAYNHNLNTASERYDDICSTHTFEDRVDTVTKTHEAGMSACSGLIAGTGETHEDLVSVVFSLKEIGSDSIPVNFLIPFDGTPLSQEWNLTPAECLRILAMVRFVCPDSEVRIAGGREIHLRSLQPLGLHIANSIFLGDYLTSEGQAATADLEMIADAGFVVEDKETEPGQLLARGLHRADLVDETLAAGGCGGHGAEGTDGGCGGCGSACGGHGAPGASADAIDAAETADVDADRAAADRVLATAAAFHDGAGQQDAHAGQVRVRRRGIGTEVAPNA